jgi:hypothetical protein
MAEEVEITDAMTGEVVATETVRDAHEAYTPATDRWDNPPNSTAEHDVRAWFANDRTRPGRNPHLAKLMDGWEAELFGARKPFSTEVQCPRCKHVYTADESEFKVDESTFSASGHCPHCQLETVVEFY